MIGHSVKGNSGNEKLVEKALTVAITTRDRDADESRALVGSSLKYFQMDFANGMGTIDTTTHGDTASTPPS